MYLLTTYNGIHNSLALLHFEICAVLVPSLSGQS